MKPTDLARRAAPLVSSRGASGPASAAAELVEEPIEQVLSRSAGVLEHAQELVLGAAMRADAAQGQIVLDRTRKLGRRPGHLSATVGLPVQLAEDLIAVRTGTQAALDAIAALDSVPWRTRLPHATHVADRAESGWAEMRQAVVGARDRSDKLAAASAKLATSTPDGFKATWRDGIGRHEGDLRGAQKRAEVAMRQTMTSRGVAVESPSDLEVAATLVDPVIRHRSAIRQEVLLSGHIAKAKAVTGRTAVSSLANDLHDAQRRIGDVQARIKEALTDVQSPDAAHQLEARAAAQQKTLNESRELVRRLLDQ